MSNNKIDLFLSYKLGNLELPNRIVMAPMTRCRAVQGNVPSPLAPAYYRQRASAGLMITEATQISPRGIGYVRTPGIHSQEQVEGWKKVTEAVHQAKGRIFLQLWHVGRVSHPDFHGGELPVGPSALEFVGEVHTHLGKKKMERPRALRLEEMPGIVEQFRKGAEHARAAGFDGVEIHGANAYLLDQFLRDSSNQRTDRYGGSIQNRARLPLEIAEAVCSVWGAERVGYRISPHMAYFSMSDSNPKETFSYLTKELNAMKLGYLHLMEAVSGLRAPASDEARVAGTLRKLFNQAFMINGGFDARTGSQAVETGGADLVSFGVPYLANPDLPQRYRLNAPLNTPDNATFYAGEEHGYTDYPTLSSTSI